MRLTELVIENYGSYDRRMLTLPEEAGLTLVYGPNEAGKSTCLEAISDFLFSIPKNTARGNLFGYDGMRIGATMRTADGKLVALRRRKGNGKTLMDAAGNALDETVLASILGAITRDRFTTLFGLDHESLRVGGDRLLHAEGDIGRLIVEAGGGLRGLVQRLESIDTEANALFSKTRAGSRAFYQGLAEYETADKAVRANQLTRETYEQTRKAAEASAAAADGLRAERRQLATTIAALERILRVAPHLREREQLQEEFASFDDAAGFADGFSARVQDALVHAGEAAKALERAGQQRDKLAARVAGLEVSRPLVAAEKDVRALSERALHVAKARGDRPNRQRDIDEGEAQLANLRRMLGAGPDEDLAPKLPEPAAVEQVRALAAEAIERMPSLNAAARRVSELTGSLAVIDARIESAKRDGCAAPLDIAASQFASLAAQKAGLDARQRGTDAAAARLAENLATLEVQSLAELRQLRCPAPELVRAEQAAREKIETQQTEQERLKREALAEIASGEAEIGALEAAGRIATQAAVANARAQRTSLWAPIRTAFVDGSAADDPHVRAGAASAFETQLADADDLADRRADEAERAAALGEALRRIARSREKLAGTERELRALEQQLYGRESLFLADHPITAQRPVLAALLDFSERRQQLLEAANAIQAQGDEIAIDAAQLTPTIELLGLAEVRLGLASHESVALRVAAVQSALARHEAYLRDDGDRKELGEQLKAILTESDRLASEQSAWEQQWPEAVLPLGLAAETTPQAASAIATEWAAARGILTAIAQARQRLVRMDEDEAALGGDVAAHSERLKIDIPVDPVAGAKMLDDRWTANEAIRVQHDGLKPDLEETKISVTLAGRDHGLAEEELDRLAVEAGVARTDLAFAAERHQLRLDCAARLALVERTAIEAGDRLSIAELTEQWASRDLDVLRAAHTEARARSLEIDGELEIAILAEKTARDALAAFSSESRASLAIVDRESASAQMHQALERYLELSLARDVVSAAMAHIRAEQQDPLIAHAAALFTASTRGEFTGIETDIDDKGQPVVVGRRANGGTATVSMMSDGTRDQLFLSFRLASLENYASATEPLPFVADDILVHFDDDRSKATLDLLADFAKTSQVLLFTHHRSVRALAEPLVSAGLANIVDLGG